MDETEKMNQQAADTAQNTAEETSAAMETVQASENTAEKKANDTGSAQAKQPEKVNWVRELLSWVIMFVVAYLLALFITRVIIIKTEIISGSMISTLNIDDRVVGNRMAYWFKGPERGDIVFFAFPDDESKTYVKRVIGLPGETVNIRNGKVYINDSATPLDEPYLREEMEPEPDASFYVPDGCYFVMGDNRNVSADARYWKTKYVTAKQIYAKAWLRYKPTIDMIKSATY